MQVLADASEFNVNESLEDAERTERLEQRRAVYYLRLRSHLTELEKRDREVALVRFLMQYEQVVMRDGYRYLRSDLVERQWHLDAPSARNHRCTKSRCRQFHAPKGTALQHPLDPECRMLSSGEVFVCRLTALTHVCPLAEHCEYTSVVKGTEGKPQFYQCRLSGGYKGRYLERVPEYDENAKISHSRLKSMRTREENDNRDGDYNSDSDCSYDEEDAGESYDMEDSAEAEEDRAGIDLDGDEDDAQIAMREAALQKRIKKGEVPALQPPQSTSPDASVTRHDEELVQPEVLPGSRQSLNHMFYRFNTLSEALRFTRVASLDAVVQLMMDEEQRLGVAPTTAPKAVLVAKKRKTAETATKSGTAPKKRRAPSGLGVTRTPEERIAHYMRDPEGRRAKLAQVVQLLTSYENKLAMFDVHVRAAVQTANDRLVATKRKLHITQCSQMAMYELWWSAVLQAIPPAPQRPLERFKGDIYVQVILEVWELCVYSPFGRAESETLNLVKIAFAVLYAMADVGHFFMDCSVPAGYLEEAGATREIDGVDLSEFHVPMLPHGPKLAQALLPASRALELSGTVRASINFNDKTASQGTKQLKQCFVSTVERVRQRLINDLAARPEQNATLLREYISTCVGLRCTGHGRRTAVHGDDGEALH